ncbi:MAG TPA: DoxX family protein [Polyangia bacterium]|jgi:putative oxidoreductase|nr:DoxX family protein [Polyangia bacterium]
MLARLLATDDSRVLTLQRLVLGGVMFPHGAQKLLGWFAPGGGFHTTMNMLAQHGHVPSPIAFLVIVSEFFGSLLLAVGLFTRVAAFGCACTMTGAILMVHLHNGFFMNWQGVQHGEGFEYHLLALALAIPLMFRGGGALAVDGWLARYFSSRRALQPGGKTGAAPTFAV